MNEHEISSIGAEGNWKKGREGKRRKKGEKMTKLRQGRLEWCRNENETSKNGSRDNSFLERTEKNGRKRREEAIAKWKEEEMERKAHLV